MGWDGKREKRERERERERETERERERVREIYRNSLILLPYLDVNMIFHFSGLSSSASSAPLPPVKVDLYCEDPVSPNTM